MENKDLRFLGKKTNYVFEYNNDLLDVFENKLETEALIKLDAIEFTTLCPITGQPDYAEIVINYVPNKLLIESKSLKLYLNTFRNKGNFHEDVVNTIMKDLINKLNPKYIEVLGKFHPRGGISIWPFCNHAGDEKYSLWVMQRKLDYAKI